MWRHIALYGVIGGLLVVALRVTEYRWLIIDRSLEIYGGIVAALFAGLGVWLGGRVTRKKTDIVVKEVPVEVPVEIPVEVRVEVPVTGPFVRDDARVSALGLTPRELEMLEMLAAGLSNREITEKAFVSENTVKTHVQRVLDKIGPRRRTQAVQMAREQRLIA
ncbi:MAG: response regulator transcription factor [Gemmatimonadetes bacterium]|nr:response regulator transcription factor [Gemmatimonadota bacterium]